MVEINRLPDCRWLIVLCLALRLWGTGTAAEPSSAREFSADIVSRDAAGLPVGARGRLYVANRKVRIDPSEAPSGFFLTDGDAGTAIVVVPARRIFMEAKRSSRLTQVFVPVDPNEPCRQWKAAAANAGERGADGDWHCTRIDGANHGDQEIVEYQVISPDRAVSERWIDPELGFPVKLRAADGSSISLEHVREDAQPASLFSLPPDYRKLDPRALLERIKHSDVWVGQTSP
jgi:hypothetical protein